MTVGGWRRAWVWHRAPGCRGDYRKIVVVFPSLQCDKYGVSLRWGRVRYSTKFGEDRAEWARIRMATDTTRWLAPVEPTLWDQWAANNELVAA